MNSHTNAPRGINILIKIYSKDSTKPRVISDKPMIRFKFICKKWKQKNLKKHVYKNKIEMNKKPTQKTKKHY